MKKRILCVLLTLIMLISLVPATAITASAASNAISESGILVLKQLEGYQMTCEDGYIGYGAKCPSCLGKAGVNAPIDGCTKVMYEKEADTILRKELKELDKAVNSFASNNGLALSQNQHDALVMFSFQNGTAWTIGTGALQTAIKSGYTGSKFLDAICKWNYSNSDDARRMVEANMYLNGIYSSKTPARYIGVEFTVKSGEGSIDADKRQYYDVASPSTINVKATPANKDNAFLGWYTKEEGGERVTVLNSTHAAVYAENCPKLLKLYAVWQAKDAEPGDSTNVIEYTISKSNLTSTSVYNVPNGTKVTTYINEYSKEVKIELGNTLNVVDDYVDEKGVFWAKIAADTVKVDGVEVTPTIGWVKVKGGAATGAGSDLTMDLTVKVTNSYVNIRSSASASSTKQGTFNQGDTLRIINVKNAANGYLWGEVAAGKDDDTAIGWVALMYTDYDQVVASANNNAAANNGTVVATATITYQGYVNVRSDAGINNQIVGSLSRGMTVDLYETKYVNGIQWGRCSAGWFCLTYADVTRLVADNTGAADVGFTNYIFSGSLIDWQEDADNFNDEFFFVTPGGEAVKRNTVKDKDGNEEDVPMTSKAVTIGNLTEVGGTDWAKTSYGWIEVSKIKLDVAKFYVIADTLTIRNQPNTAAERVDLLVKGTEFDVSKINVVGETIWGWANKVGETDLTYHGWANLSNENVSRNGAPEASIGGTGSSESATVTMAKVVGTDSLNVRITGATYAKAIGKLSYGTTAVVLEEDDGWYKLDIDVDNDPTTDSWVSGNYLEIYEGTPNSGNASTGGTAATPVTGTGIVANTYTGVNIRTAPGTGNAAVGKYLTGTTVEILEVTTHGTSKWGRTDKGWVCMDYIVMMEGFNPNGSGAGSNTTTTSKIVIYTGKLTEATTIYKDTATNTDSEPIGEKVRKDLPAGYPVTVHEIIVQVEYDNDPETDSFEEDNEGATSTVTKRTTYWARINDGYIFAPGNCIELDTLDEHAYTVEIDKTKVYDDWDPASRSQKSFTLAKGTKVLVTELHIVNSSVWGYVECVDYAKEGWVDLSNMDKGFASSTAPEVEENTNTGNTGNAGNTGSTETPGPVQGSTGNTTNGYANASGHKYTGKVINTNSVNVRATASTGANITTTLKNGAALVIYETVISEGMAWGRCDAGWIYLYYVDLTPTVNGAVDARVVYNDNTVIYSDMGMSQASGSTYAKMAVVDIYEIVGKMARTDMGWIHTDNLL